MVVWDYLGDCVSGEDQLAVDHTGYLDDLAQLFIHLILKRLPLWASGRISHYRLIQRLTHGAWEANRLT